MMGKNFTGFLGALVGSIVGVILVGSYIIRKESKNVQNKNPHAPQEAEPIP
jgi:cytosine/uracil/thiamine/allantoin permease